MKKHYNFKRLFLVSFLFFLYTSTIAQNIHIIIKGTVNQITTSNQVILSLSDKILHLPIRLDKSFLMDTMFTREGVAWIKTDSTSATHIWLSEGSYILKLEEVMQIGANQPTIKIVKLEGPQYSVLYNTFQQHLEFIGIGDKLSAQRTYVKSSLDSLLNIDPSSKVLPDLLGIGKLVLKSSDIVYYKNRIKTPGSAEALKYLLKEMRQREALQPGLAFRKFTMKDLYGRKFKLSSLKSKLTLVEFWASDCPACRGSHGSLRNLYSKYHDRGLEIVSISTDNNKKDWLSAIKKDGMNWINVSDLKGWDNVIAKKYYVFYVPVYVWLDSKHNIIGRGMQDKDIEQVLNNKKSTTKSKAVLTLSKIT